MITLQCRNHPVMVMMMMMLQPLVATTCRCRSWRLISGSSLQWLMNNPVSAAVALGTLIISVATALLAVRVYRQLVRKINDNEEGRGRRECLYHVA